MDESERATPGDVIADEWAHYTGAPARVQPFPQRAASLPHSREREPGETHSFMTEG